MMKAFVTATILGLIILCLVPSAGAQETTAATCPAIVEQAIEAVGEVCSGTGRNQACYGNVLLNAEVAEGVDALTFEASGDLADLVDLQSIAATPMNLEAGTWGVALLRVQANLPETLPGQNVTFLLFGDAEITNAAQPAPEAVLLEATSTGSINVRSGPSTGDAVLGSLNAGETVTVDGRNAAGDWLRIQLEDGGVGWVFAELVTVDGDAATLAELSADDAEPLGTAAAYGPMQAFYFSSGTADALCEEAPDSGLLIQTPQGTTEITLNVNGVDISLGSTLLLNADAPEDDADLGELAISLLEGEATVSVADETRTLIAGTRVTVPIDADLEAAGPPSDAEPYDAEALDALPIALLEDEIAIAEPPTEEELAEASSLTPLSGAWLFSFTSLEASGGCPPEVGAAMEIGLGSVGDSPIEIDFSGGFTATNLENLAAALGGGGTGVEYFDVEPGVVGFRFSADGSVFETIYTLVDPALITFTGTLDFGSILSGCVINVAGQAEHQG